MKSIAIIGAGLGGLECGYILQKHGFQVTILEKNPVVGGCFQSFKRKSQVFDTGFHYIGGIGENEVMHQQLKYLGLENLPWLQQNKTTTELIVIKNNNYTIPSGVDVYKNHLIDLFPKEIDGINKYCDLLKNTGEHILDVLQNNETDNIQLFTKLSNISAYEYINCTFSDETLKKLILGNAFKLDNNKNTLSLYALAQISNSYIQSSWKLIGGGQVLVNKLVENFTDAGGNIITHAKVLKLEQEKEKITTIIYTDGYLTPDYVISDIDPTTTFNLINSPLARKSIYFRRIAKLERTHGFLTINIVLKPNRLRYTSYDIFIHTGDDIWLSEDSSNGDFLINFYPPQNSVFISAMDIITPMKYEEVQQWDIPDYQQNSNYKAFKERMATQCINIVDNYIPHFKESIDSFYVSTPLTYKRYTGAVNGTGFGIRKNYTAPLTSIIAPRTPIKNLFLTGQNNNLHGMLGVTMSSLNTCSEFIDKTQLYKEII